MNMRSPIWFCWAFVFITLTACAPTPIMEGAAPGIKIDSQLAPNATMHLNSVAILDKSLQYWDKDGKGWRSKVAVEATSSRRTATGTLEAWATIRNRTDFPLQLEGRVSFFDASQAPVEGPSQWKRVMLPPNSVASYKEFSMMSNLPMYYYIEVREGR